jgi:hypothetical protein
MGGVDGVEATDADVVDRLFLSSASPGDDARRAHPVTRRSA